MVGKSLFQGVSGSLFKVDSFQDGFQWKLPPAEDLGYGNKSWREAMAWGDLTGHLKQLKNPSSLVNNPQASGLAYQPALECLLAFPC